jgi:hypothetical protein
MHNHHHSLSVKLLLSLLDLSNYMCSFLGNEGTKIQDILLSISPTITTAPTIDQTTITEIRSALECVSALHDKIATTTGPDLTYSDRMEMRATLVVVLDAARVLVVSNESLNVAADMCDATTLDEFIGVDDCE